MRMFRYMATTAASLALALAGAVPAAATTTWTLEPSEQRICVDPEFGHPFTYFIASVSGTWSKTITTGLGNLPQAPSPSAHQSSHQAHTRTHPA